MSEPSSDFESLKQEHHALLKLVQALVIVLVVFSASLNVFLLREVTLVRNDLKQRQQVIDQYRETGHERLESFLSEMRVFAEDHPDFAPVLNTYFPQTNQVIAVESPSAEKDSEALLETD